MSTGDKYGAKERFEMVSHTFNTSTKSHIVMILEYIYVQCL